MCDLWWYSARADMFPRVRGRVVEPVMFEAEEKKNKNKNKNELKWFLKIARQRECFRLTTLVVFKMDL